MHNGQQQQASTVPRENPPLQTVELVRGGTMNFVVMVGGRVLPPGSARLTVTMGLPPGLSENHQLSNNFCNCCSSGAPLMDLENESLNSASAIGSPTPNNVNISSSRSGFEGESNELPPLDGMIRSYNSILEEFNDDIFSEVPEQDQDLQIQPSSTSKTNENTMIPNDISVPLPPTSSSMKSTKAWVMKTKRIKRRGTKRMAYTAETETSTEKKKKAKRNVRAPKAKARADSQSVEKKLQNVTDWTTAPPELINIGRAEGSDGDNENIYYVEKILGIRRRQGNGQKLFLVKWLGWPEEHNSWEPHCNFNKVKGEPLDIFLTAQKKNIETKNDLAIFNEFRSLKQRGSLWEKVEYKISLE